MMITITINGKKHRFEEACTILQAAREVGIEIPTMCFHKELGYFTSCMICLVKDVKKDALVPACSTVMTDGMAIETDGEEVMTARRICLELLLSEHIGDCEGPCRNVCPFSIAIPRVLRHIAAGERDAAYEIIMTDSALPALMCTVCEAPCERICRRGLHDAPVSIRRLMINAAMYGHSHGKGGAGGAEQKQDVRIAIIGAGVAGLTAAYHLTCAGYTPTLFNVGESSLAAELTSGSTMPGDDIVRNELMWLQQREICLEQAPVPVMDELIKCYDGILITIPGWDLPADEMTRVSNSLSTNGKNIFVCGKALNPALSPVKSAVSGKKAARYIVGCITGDNQQGEKRQFRSVIGKLQPGETDVFVELAGRTTGTDDRAQARRCLHCDCRKPDACKLRDYATRYNAKQGHYRPAERRRITIESHLTTIVFEPGKCIKCAICIRLAERQGVKIGYTFSGRGYDSAVTVPDYDTYNKEEIAPLIMECAKACPTGAIAKR